MTKPEAIEQAKQELAQTGVTQFVMRRGDVYKVFPSTQPTPTGWKTAEMISRGNVHAYQTAARVLVLTVLMLAGLAASAQGPAQPEAQTVNLALAALPDAPELALAVSPVRVPPASPLQHSQRSRLAGLTRAEWAELGADGAMRGLDAWSTGRALRCACNREANALPGQWIAHRPAAEWAYSLGVVAGEAQAMRWLERRDGGRGGWRHRVAVMLPALDVGYDLPAVVHNLGLSTRAGAGRAGAGLAPMAATVPTADLFAGYGPPTGRAVGPERGRMGDWGPVRARPVAEGAAR